MRQQKTHFEKNSSSSSVNGRKWLFAIDVRKWDGSLEKHERHNKTVTFHLNFPLNIWKCMYQNKDYLGWVLVQVQMYSKVLGWSLGDRLPNLKLHRIQNKIDALIFSKTEHFLLVLLYCVRRSHTGVILFPTLKAIFDDSSAEHGLEGMTHDGFNHLIHSENTHLGLQKVMTATWIISPLLLLQYFFALYMGNIPWHSPLPLPFDRKKQPKTLNITAKNIFIAKL